MKFIDKVLTRFLHFRLFRIFFARVYPFLKRHKIIDLVTKINRGSLSDHYDLNENRKEGSLRTYDLVNFNESVAFEKYTIDPKKLLKSGRKFKFGFLEDSEYDQDDVRKACIALNVDFTIFDIRDKSVYKKILSSDCDGIFIHPYYNNNIIRSAFQEVAQLLATETNIKIYPTIRELNIYESKRSLAGFLSVNNIPHPSTYVFYDFAGAIEYLETCRYPVVFKTHCGASASGVEILKNKKQALKLADQLFHKYYLRKMESEKRNREWGYMLIQEYIDNVKEFRVIKVGDSWFGYQKWKEQDQVFLSGSGKQKMTGPSFKLLRFCSAIADKFCFTTMCFDVFENKNGDYLINELQTWFGSFDPSEMYVNDIPGRYLKIRNKWIFEPGFYNVCGSNLLRISDFISILQAEEEPDKSYIQNT